MGKLICLCIVVVIECFPLAVGAQAEIKNIVIFFGANETLPAYKSILEGFERQFSKDYQSRYNLRIEYLDMERFPNEEYQKQLINLYNRKYGQSQIDLIIAVAPGGYDLLIKQGLKALHRSPTIAVEIIGANPERYPADHPVVEIRIPYTPRRTLESAFALFPDRRKALIVGGCSASDLAYANRIFQDTSYFSKTHDFEILTCIDFDSTLHKIGQLSEDYIVFCPSYITDIDGAPFSTSYAVRQFSSTSKTPLFTMSDNCITNGGIGGDIISFDAVGVKCGAVASDILKHGASKGLKIIEDDFYRSLYNWQELKKWGVLKSKSIPRSSTFFNEDMTFFKHYRKQIILSMLIIIFQTVLISYLIRLIRAQRKVALQKTENERLYRELVREQRLNLMAQLTGSLSHELNQPLAAILFNAQAGLRLLTSGKLTDQKTEDILSDIVDDDKRAAGIIASVRNMMRPGIMEKGMVDIGMLISESLAILHMELRKEKVKVIYRMPDVPIVAFGDKIQIQQVVINLILNAITAMQETPIQQKKILIHLTLHDTLITVEVCDSGTGIPEEMLLKIFSSFSTTRSGNMGMGLSISKSIIANHGGKIWVQNRPEGGARFSFTLRTDENG